MDSDITWGIGPSHTGWLSLPHGLVSVLHRCDSVMTDCCCLENNDNGNLKGVFNGTTFTALTPVDVPPRCNCDTTVTLWACALQYEDFPQVDEYIIMNVWQLPVLGESVVYSVCEQLRGLSWGFHCRRPWLEVRVELWWHTTRARSPLHAICSRYLLIVAIVEVNAKRKSGLI